MHGLQLRGEHGRTQGAAPLPCGAEAPAKANGCVAHEAAHLDTHLMGCQRPATRRGINNLGLWSSSNLQPPMMRVLDKTFNARQQGLWVSLQCIRFDKIYEASQLLISVPPANVVFA